MPAEITDKDARRRKRIRWVIIIIFVILDLVALGVIWNAVNKGFT